MRTRSVVLVCLVAGAVGCGGSGGSANHAALWATMQARPMDVPGFAPQQPAAEAAQARAAAEALTGMVGVGGAHACGVTPSGTVKCWGAGQLGQLGNGVVGSYEPYVAPQADAAVDVTWLSDVTAIAGGGRSTCALSLGEVWCWGYDWYGALGSFLWNRDTAPPGCSEPEPVRVDALGTTQVTTMTGGANHACALTAQGTVKCWGWWLNYDGEMPYDYRQASMQVADVAEVTGASLPVIAAIGAGEFHTCLAPAAGGLLCFGMNDGGQLGDGSGVEHYAPVAVPGLAGERIDAIAAGWRHTCVLTAGRVKCWGANDRGQLGDGTTEPRLGPVDVIGLEGQTVAAIAAGSSTTCAVLGAGDVRCWGDNGYGELGIGAGDADPHPSPEAVVSLDPSPIQSISAHGGFVCIGTGGGAQCWGTGSGPAGPDDARTVSAPLHLEPGAAHFDVGGRQHFVATRNVAGRNLGEILGLLDKARDEGTRLVRIHVSHDPFGFGFGASGALDEAWAASWDQVFARAEADGLSVVPVFGVWADWNDGSAGETWHSWHLNPLNSANGGPGHSPAELYQEGSAARARWLSWLGNVVSRWQRHRNMAAWEVFSELDLVTHTGDAAAFEATGVAFVEAAAARIRAADPAHRPVTASLAGWGMWPTLHASAAIDLVQIHLYGPDQQLDQAILSAADALRSLGKPMLLGESGLDWHAPDGTTITTAAQGPIATRHAVWAALVAGMMNGRALWWEDGYDILQNGDPGVPFVNDYPAVERPALRFAGGRDLQGMQHLDTISDAGLVGGALGNGNVVLGWYRSAACQPPGWDCQSLLSGRSLTIAVPGTATVWHAQFHDAVTGAPVGSRVDLTRASGSAELQVPLPAFRDGIAFLLTRDP